MSGGGFNFIFLNKGVEPDHNECTGTDVTRKNAFLFVPIQQILLFSWSHYNCCKWLAQLKQYISDNNLGINPFCFNNTTDVPFVLLFFLCSGERSLTAPKQGQVATLTDRLICCILHCCSSPASRENWIYSRRANVNQIPLLLLWCVCLECLHVFLCQHMLVN